MKPEASELSNRILAIFPRGPAPNIYAQYEGQLAPIEITWFYDHIGGRPWHELLQERLVGLGESFMLMLPDEVAYYIPLWLLAVIEDEGTEDVAGLEHIELVKQLRIIENWDDYFNVEQLDACVDTLKFVTGTPIYEPDFGDDINFGLAFDNLAAARARAVERESSDGRDE